MPKLVTLALCAAIIAAHAFPDVIHVPADYPTIQGAILASTDGDTVLVAPGEYIENINFRGKNIMVASEFIFTADPVTIVNTIINGSNPVQTDTGSCVIISSGEDTSAVLAGFTLTGGIGTKWVDEHFAGTYVEGGGILIQYSSPTIRNNRIIGNHAIRVLSGAISAGGGGIRVGDSTPRILNNVIMDNEGLYGGGIVFNYTGGLIRNNIIANNRVYPAAGSAPTFGGGGIWIWQNFGTEQKVVENNTVFGNSVSGTGGSFAGRGGGILVAGTTAYIRNTIIWDNTQVTGGQIGVSNAGNPVVSYTDVPGGYTGTGNLDLDPAISDTSFYLTPSSPCVDAGDTSSVYDDLEDPLNPGSALWPAMGGIRNDIGAYGGPGSEPLGSFPITDVREDTPRRIPEGFRLDQNYPNPFNPTTTIVYSLGERMQVFLTVSDLLGRTVATLVNETKDPGTYEVVWNAAGQATGVYLYTLSSGSRRDTKKLLLMR